jgi:hypothetical protein
MHQITPTGKITRAVKYRAASKHCETGWGLETVQTWGEGRTKNGCVRVLHMKLMCNKGGHTFVCNLITPTKHISHNISIRHK